MANKDAKFFNCSEEHEINHVCSKYEDKEKVKEFIKSKCKDKTIHYWTHEKLASFLAENGFKLKTKITQTELIAKLSEKFDSRAQAQTAFNAVIESIENVVKSGSSLTIKGFGTFKVVERAPRKGRDPRTGKEMEIGASRTVKFTPSSALKDELMAKK